MTKRVAILASGRGSNARAILDYFSDKSDVEFALIASNKADAGVFEIAMESHIPTFVLDKENLVETNEFVEYLQELEIDLVVLAGFLWFIPEAMVEAFDKRIVNIHPSLLPKFGGKGMYGMHVHTAVSEGKESETGMTIHYVNQAYDEGEIIFQGKVDITPGEDPNSIAAKVLELEHHHYARIIENILA